MTERSDAKSAERRSASNISCFYFGTKIRFALLASLRSAIFIEIQVDNFLVTFPERVNLIFS